MKNLLILILLFFHVWQSFSQVDNQMVESTCKCLINTLNSKNEKIKFQFAHEECFKEAYSKAISLKSADSAELYIENFIDVLSAECDSYVKCHEILEKYSLQKSEIRIKDRKICKQVMRVGEFEDTSGIERTVMSMRDSIQIMTFGKPEIYTKSKVVWKDECTYNVVFIESTNTFENALLKKGDERVIRIIDILNNEEIIYEVEMFGRWLVGRVKKID